MTTAADLVPWFQIGATIITGIGVVVSTTIGIVTLKNAHRDRVAKIQPNLLFNLGGNIVRCVLEERETLPGIDPQSSGEFLAGRGGRCLALSNNGPIGQLFNHGRGLALDVHVWFRAEEVAYGQSRYRLTPQQMNSAPYSKDWNIAATTPSSIPSGDGAAVYRLPTAIFFADQGLIEVNGLTFIECKDAENREYQWSQPTTVHFNRAAAEGVELIFTFGQRRELAL